MALSMEEERILAEIASQLGHDDPVLASRFSRFGRPPARDPKHRIVAVIVIASLVIVTLMGIAIAA